MMTAVRRRALLLLLSCLIKVSTTTRWSFAYFPAGANFSSGAVNYDAITHVIDVSSKILAAADGSITVADDWPSVGAIKAAETYSKALGVSLSGEDKDAQDALVADPAARATLVAQLTALLRRLRRDSTSTSGTNITQVMVDFEGLASTTECREGFTSLAASLAAALEPESVDVVPTIWAAKLYEEVNYDTGYDAAALCASVGNAAVLIMGYDLNPLDLPSGVSGWQVASGNAPLPNLQDALNHTIAGLGCDPQRVVLGLPWYGRLYTCDGGSGPLYPGAGNCSCATDNMKKKSFDLLDGLGSSSDCFFGYDDASSSRVVECPRGSGLPNSGSTNATSRQQAWYDDASTLERKYALAAAWGLRGIGVWTAASASANNALAPSSPNGTFPRDGDMWAALKAYAAG